MFRMRGVWTLCVVPATTKSGHPDMSDYGVAGKPEESGKFVWGTLLNYQLQRSLTSFSDCCRQNTHSKPRSAGQRYSKFSNAWREKRLRRRIVNLCCNTKVSKSWTKSRWRGLQLSITNSLDVQPLRRSRHCVQQSRRDISLSYQSRCQSLSRHPSSIPHFLRRHWITVLIWFIPTCDSVDCRRHVGAPHHCKDGDILINLY